MATTTSLMTAADLLAMPDDGFHRHELVNWYAETRKADWATPAQVTQQWPRTSIVGSTRAVFRIKGNAYRLVVDIFYPGRKVYITFIGTHAEYDRINAAEV